MTETWTLLQASVDSFWNPCQPTPVPFFWSSLSAQWDAYGSETHPVGMDEATLSHLPPWGKEVRTDHLSPPLQGP